MTIVNNTYVFAPKASSTETCIVQHDCNNNCRIHTANLGTVLHDGGNTRTQINEFQRWHRVQVPCVVRKRTDAETTHDIPRWIRIDGESLQELYNFASPSVLHSLKKVESQFERLLFSNPCISRVIRQWLLRPKENPSR